MEEKKLEIKEIRKFEDKIDKQKFICKLKRFGSIISEAAGVVAAVFAGLNINQHYNAPIQVNGVGYFTRDVFSSGTMGEALMFGGIATVCGIVGVVAGRLASKNKKKVERMEEDLEELKGSSNNRKIITFKRS